MGIIAAQEVASNLVTGHFSDYIGGIVFKKMPSDLNLPSWVTIKKQDGWYLATFKNNECLGNWHICFFDEYLDLHKLLTRCYVEENYVYGIYVDHTNNNRPGIKLSELSFYNDDKPLPTYNYDNIKSTPCRVTFNGSGYVRISACFFNICSETPVEVMRLLFPEGMFVRVPMEVGITVDTKPKVPRLEWLAYKTISTIPDWVRPVKGWESYTVVS